MKWGYLLKSELVTSDARSFAVEIVLADGSPYAVVPDFQSTFEARSTSSQSQHCSCKTRYSHLTCKLKLSRNGSPCQRFRRFKDIWYGWGCRWWVTGRACERSGKRSGAGRKSGERERSGEQTFQKTLERKKSVERASAEQEWSWAQDKSADQSPLTPNISLI